MSCQDWELRIALDVEGDLAEQEARELREHLASCEACRRFAVEMRQSQQALHALGEEEPLVGSVQARVLAGIDRRRRFHLGWTWGLAAAAAALAIVFGVARFAQVEPAGPPLPQVAVQAPHFDLPPVARPNKPLAYTRGSVSRSRVMSHLPSRDREGAGAEPLVVKLLTPDPNVVIYWLVDRKAGTE